MTGATMRSSAIVAALLAVGASAQPKSLTFGPSSFVAPGAYPTSVYKHYYNNPTQTSVQVQPVITDPVLHTTYPFDLTNPDTLPTTDTVDPRPLPTPASNAQILSAALTQLNSIKSNPIFKSDACAACLAKLEVGKFVSLASPTEAVNITEEIFGASNPGWFLAQILQVTDVGGYDGQLLCSNFLGSACPLPPTPALNLTGWFAKPKPNPLPPPKTPSGKRLKVLHLSDFHIDPRYATGAEANCTSGLCCRSNAHNSHSPNVSLFPAPRYGSYLCDTPEALAQAVLAAIPVLTGTEHTGFDYTIYTGDLVSHDPGNELSREYTLYTEVVVYDLFKRLINSGPIYVTLGNHDSYNEAQDSPHNLGGDLTNQFSWNYDHVAGLWEQEGWLPESAINLAKGHYAAYSVQRSDGLRIITLNTDFWYNDNMFNYINLAGADNAGMLRFLTDELQDAEDAGDRVWILGHVLAGWDGTNALQSPTNLFYQIVDRFSPHVIADIFWGHSHEDELSIFYTNNGTNISAENALAVSWVTPSVTPLTNLNSGFRVYEVDSATFDILDAHTWRSDVNSFPELDDQIENGPTYVYEYSTRDTYGANITGWGVNDPLNATWWHLVTEQMEINSSLVTTFNTFQGKSSVKSPACTGDCITAKICYMRSGSSSLALQNCIPGFGSVQ